MSEGSHVTEVLSIFSESAKDAARALIQQLSSADAKIRNKAANDILSYCMPEKIQEHLAYFTNMKTEDLKAFIKGAIEDGKLDPDGGPAGPGVADKTGDLVKAKPAKHTCNKR